MKTHTHTRARARTHVVLTRPVFYCNSHRFCIDDGDHYVLTHRFFSQPNYLQLRSMLQVFLIVSKETRLQRHLKNTHISLKFLKITHSYYDSVWD